MDDQQIIEIQTDSGSFIGFVEKSKIGGKINRTRIRLATGIIICRMGQILQKMSWHVEFLQIARKIETSGEITDELS